MRFSSFAVLILGLALAAPVFALDVPLTYAAYPKEMNQFHPYGGQHLQASQTVPAGEWKLPPLVAKIPLYGLVEFGDKKYLMVLDFTKPEDTFYSRILFDANANNDLTDDPVLQGKANWSNENQYASLQIDNVTEIDITVGGKNVKYSFRPQANGWFQNKTPDFSKPESLQNISVYLRTNCSYKGEFDLNGVHYTVELGDRNANGRFDEVFDASSTNSSQDQLYGKGDSFYISVDSKCDYSSEMSLGDKLVLGESVFQVQVNTPESKLTLTPITENLASLKIPEKVERLVLAGGDLKNGLMAFRPEKAMKVPAGDYRLLTYQLLREDKQGDLWRLNARGTKKGDVKTAKKGSQASLEMGEPYRPLVEVPEWVRNNMRNSASKDVQISFALRGKGDEIVADVARIQGTKTKTPMSAQNSSRPKEPTYKIVKNDGEVVKQGQFEYG